VPLGGFGRHHYALEPVHEIDRIYQSNNNLFLSVPLLPLHISQHIDKRQVDLLTCVERSLGRADDFWEASSRRLTWRCRGKRRPVIIANDRDGGVQRNPCTQITIIHHRERRNFIRVVDVLFDAFVPSNFFRSVICKPAKICFTKRGRETRPKYRKGEAAGTTEANAKRGQRGEKKKGATTSSTLRAGPRPRLV